MQPSKKARVLVADDEVLACEMICGLLEDCGYVVVGRATDGWQAVQMVRSSQPDVVIMDIDMPHMSGIEAINTIHQVCPTPVVMLTAYESDELVEQASVAGAGAYLVKPPREREIRRAISIAMARFRDTAELRCVNAKLREALHQAKALTGMLCMCANCRRIRDDLDQWQSLEAYIQDHSDVQFSHGLCSECATRLYPDFFKGDR